MLGAVFIDGDDDQVLAHQVPDHLERASQNNGKDGRPQSKVKLLGLFVAILVDTCHFTKDDSVGDRCVLTEVLRVETDQLISLRRL